MIGKRIRLLRNEKGVSQEELSKVIGVTTSAISMYETGARKPSYEVISRLADYFNVTMDFIVGRTEVRNSINTPQDVNELMKVDPDLLIELCRAKDLPEEERRRIKEFAAFEIEKFLKSKRNKEKCNK